MEPWKLIKLLQCKQRVKVTVSVLKHYEDGLTKVISLLSEVATHERSNAVRILMEQECFDLVIFRTFLTALEIKFLNKDLFIVEFPPINKEMILNDKLIYSKKNIPTTLLYRILVLVLTSSTKDLKPFWNAELCSRSDANMQSEEKSKRLWLPIKTDCVDLDSKYLNSSLKEQMEKSSFWMKRNINPMNKSW